MSINSEEFDFDEWKDLANKDLEAFEARRKKCIKQLIDQYPGNPRFLEGLQFQLDMERRRHKGPMGSCLKLFEMMMDHFVCEFRSSLKGIDINEQGKMNEADGTRESAKVIPFSKTTGKLK